MSLEDPPKNAGCPLTKTKKSRNDNEFADEI